MDHQVIEMRQDRREWPWNFLDEVWGRRVSCPLDNMVDTQEIIGSVEYVLAVSKLKDRERDIIRMHFQQGMTYREIGERYSLSCSRIGQIISHAMRHIRARPQNRTILSIGVAAYTRYRQTVAENETVTRLVEARLKEMRLEEIRSRPKQDEESLLQGSGAVCITPLTHIEDLPLSVRAYRCMRRAGIITVADIVAYDKEKGLQRIHNLGEKTHREILDLLATVDMNQTQDDLSARRSA